MSNRRKGFFFLKWWQTVSNMWKLIETCKQIIVIMSQTGNIHRYQNPNGDLGLGAVHNRNNCQTRSTVNSSHSSLITGTSLKAHL